MQETFMVDVHSDQHIYLEDPAPYIPTWSGHGRKPEALKTDADSIRVDKWVANQPKNMWCKITLRQSTKGPLRYEFLHQRIWLWDKQQPTARLWHLIIRRNPDTQSDYKYSLSNAPATRSLKRLAFMQSQRFWVERTFEDAKSESGMSDYQLRGWVGWHHHMALVMLTMLFMLTERVSNKKKYPLLSCSDIETLLARFLPRRDTTTNEVINQLEIRHKQRRVAIESALRSRHRNRSKS
jgi:SRSO17 transposase